MNFAIRPELRPSLKKLSYILPAAFAFATSACNTYEPGVAILPRRLFGCVEKEKSIKPQIVPGEVLPNRHELSIYFPEIQRTIPVEAIGEYAKKVDLGFNQGDSVKLIIMLSTQYNKLDNQGRMNADLDLNYRLSKLLQSRHIALDETETQIRLEKSQIDICSKTPN